jgi:predicted RNA-binding Zn ribbon-like protein
MADLELVCAFVNTADLEEQRDDLIDPRGLVHWLAAHRLSGEHARASAADVAEARAVREALRELLWANNGGAVDTAKAAATLDAAGRRVGLTVRFDFKTGAIKLVPRERGVHGALGSVLAAVAEAMTDGSWQQLKACRSDTCRWAFVDSARNHSRQWCSMKVCGNRQKARTFRQRRA